jgi:hypothetical protein
MRLARHIEGDAMHRGQDVFECATCRVAMTQTAEQDQCAPALTQR